MTLFVLSKLGIIKCTKMGTAILTEARIHRRYITATSAEKSMFILSNME